MGFVREEVHMTRCDCRTELPAPLAAKPRGKCSIWNGDLGSFHGKLLSQPSTSWHHGLSSAPVRWSCLGLCCGQTVGIGLIIFSISNRNMNNADCFREETCEWCSPAPHNDVLPRSDLLLVLKIPLCGGLGNSLQSPLICCLFVALYRSVMALNSSIRSQGWYFGCLLRVLLQEPWTAFAVGGAGSSADAAHWCLSLDCTKSHKIRVFSVIWAPQGSSQSSSWPCTGQPQEFLLSFPSKTINWLFSLSPLNSCGYRSHTIKFSEALRNSAVPSEIHDTRVQNLFLHLLEHR